MSGKLRLTLQPDTDGTGQLFVEASSDGFAGSSSAWFDLQGLAEFAGELEAYPLPKEAAPMLEGGYWKDGVLDQCHVGLHFRQVDLRGTVGIGVRLAEPIHEGDRAESRGQASFEIRTDYAAVSQFAKELRELATGAGQEATLVTSHVAW